MVLDAAAAVCLVVTLLPLVPVAHGAVRVFDFARLQVIALSTAVLICAGIASLVSPATATFAAVAMAAGALAIQAGYVLPFTPLWRRQTADCATEPEDGASLSLLVCNVKQGNDDYARVTTLVDERRPDIAIFMETNAAWAEALRPCLSDFEEVVAYPQSNSYGMILASRLPLKERDIQFLLNEEVPSISCVVALPGGEAVRIVALHPEPPLPSRDTMGRDAEILLVGEMARDEELPMIVTGDLNDVAWSRTTRRFMRISRLLDPRQGRGVYNTFDARRWYLRWPLDHIFHSSDFELLDIERMPFVGSDHFPMYCRFALSKAPDNEPPEDATEADLEEASEVVRVEKNRDRPPAGTDWESE
ncbi:endonuclease/exonuclease/phosphatase family protein [Oricola sp.]|uniref:endonuclease/exonuclease/phosphatase family protein n=1 Tax=Oricola sp. TaxID=1979950 RepID=UPI0025FC96CD|nr:endonuclease/exonuclease/phosphatase family protein [Oricola sp.]MCI5078434.1 endonuclease/exonuclease/phosphatase family protein [Oricola sp.]